VTGVAEQLVDAVESDFPNRVAGTRAAHSFGIGAVGTFLPSLVAKSYCVAEVFAGPEVPAVVRFSNASGQPEPDSTVDVRGMATKFHVPSGAEMDLLMMTLPEFVVGTVEEFLNFTEAAQPKISKDESFLQKLSDLLHLRASLPAEHGQPGVVPALARFADRHRNARAAVIGIGAVVTPQSYAQVEYHAVHAFVAEGSGAERRYVRFHWLPAAGVKPLADAEGMAADYLFTELEARLAAGPARFILEMQIGELGDDPTDPTVWWPDTRRKVVMGQLSLTALVADQVTDCEQISFNPGRLLPGLACTEDPILQARLDAYQVSCGRRHGTGCPVGRS
jgi:catalase